MDGLELRPCPFCGEKKVKIRADMLPGSRMTRQWYVECESCGGRTAGIVDSSNCDDMTYRQVLDAWRKGVINWNHIHGLDAWQTIVDKVVRIEFKPCPFCGEKNIRLCAEQDNDRGGRQWYVKCFGCGCKTSGALESNYYSETYEKLVGIWEHVIEMWNKRAN